MYSKKKQNKVRYKSIIVNINDIIKIKASNTQFKTDKTRSEERPARRRYVLQLNCMLASYFVQEENKYGLFKGTRGIY